MYHIKNDKRAYASVELICSALLELLETSPFEEITISDIQRMSTVSRSTFYRNFDCIEDVLMLLCDRSFDAAFKRAEETGEEIRVAVFRYWLRMCPCSRPLSEYTAPTFLLRAGAEASRWSDTSARISRTKMCSTISRVS